MIPLIIRAIQFGVTKYGPQIARFVGKEGSKLIGDVIDLGKNGKNFDKLSDVISKGGDAKDILNNAIQSLHNFLENKEQNDNPFTKLMKEIEEVLQKPFEMMKNAPQLFFSTTPVSTSNPKTTINQPSTQLSQPSMRSR